MKFNKFILREYLKIDDKNISIYDICDILTKIGLEVEEFCIPSEEEYLNIVIGKILSIKKHENANKLSVCKVSDGINEYNVVCGANNIYQGMIVPFAKIGAIIPQGKFEIKKTNIRGEESCGMLCSIDELNIPSANNSGIFELDSTLKLGENFYNSFNIKEYYPIEIKITPNRGYANSIRGICQDLYAYDSNLFQLKQRKNIDKTYDFISQVQIYNNVENSSINLIEIKDIKLNSSPIWLKTQLNLLGFKTFNPIIDVINYTMILTGQPMHAYDKNKIGKTASLNHLKNEQEFIGLDSKTYQLLKNDLVVINENNSILSLVGILGAENTKVDDNTDSIVIEACILDSESITKTNQRLKVYSESAFRFERKTDAYFVEESILMAKNLILQICSGKASDVISQNRYTSKSIEIKLHYYNFFNIFGFTVKNEEIDRIILNLGFTIIKKEENYIICKSYSFRPEVKSEIELLEEVIRIVGFEKIPLQEIPIEYSKFNSNNSINKIRLNLEKLRYNEIISFSFINEEKNLLFQEKNQIIRLINPISQDKNVMRSTLLTGLLNALSQVNMKIKNTISFFEIGNIFYGLDKNKQFNMCSGIRALNIRNDDWQNNDNRKFDIFDIKKDVFDILSSFKIKIEKIQLEKDINDYSQFSYKIIYNNLNLGSIGIINHKILQKFNIKNNLNIYFFNLNLENIKQEKQFFDSFEKNNLPLIHREFSFLFDLDIQIDQLIKEIKKIEDVIKINITDIYYDEKINKDKKSITFEIIIYQSKQLTLSEIDAISERVIKNIEQNLNGILRDNKDVFSK